MTFEVLNIDSARIHSQEKPSSTQNLVFKTHYIFEKLKPPQKERGSVYQPHPKGRFPANLVFSNLDELEELAHSLDQKSIPVHIFKNFDSSVLFFKKPGPCEKKQGDHPTQKPIELMSYFCNLITPKNGVILDPFMGSGTTGVSALRNGFRFIGIEKEQNYFQIALDRIETLSQNEDSPSLRFNQNL